MVIYQINYHSGVQWQEQDLPMYPLLNLSIKSKINYINLLNKKIIIFVFIDKNILNDSIILIIKLKYLPK
jgi:hypothetical protein